MPLIRLRGVDHRYQRHRPHRQRCHARQSAWGLSGWRGTTVITMSRDGLTRLRVLIGIADGRLSVSADGADRGWTKTDQPAAGCVPWRPRGSDLAETRPAERPGSGCGISRDRAVDCARALCRFWSEIDGYDRRNGRSAIIAIVCHINPDLSIWNAKFKPRQCRSMLQKRQR
jgi:hypothetical protein